MSDFICDYCGEALVQHDHYGFYGLHQSGERLGNIYKCHNEQCDACHDDVFWHDKGEDSELIEGHPC